MVGANEIELAIFSGVLGAFSAMMSKIAETLEA